MKEKVLAFTRKAVRMRKYMISSGVNKKNLMRMLQLMSKLEIQMVVIKSDRSASIFFLRYCNEILELLPGQNSKSFAGLMVEYDLITKMCNTQWHGESSSATRNIPAQ